MKTESTKAEKCQVKLTVTLEPAEAAECIKTVERMFVREATLPGFRKGKAPVEIIRKTFADKISEEVSGEMIRKHYAEAVKLEKLEAVELVGVVSSSCTPEGGSFTVNVDVKPTFKLPTYKGLKIAEANLKVEDAAVAEQVERIRTGYASFVDAKDADSVATGDYVQIDYSGTVGGKSILEIAPEAKVVASGTGFWTRVEEGMFLKEILDALYGMKVGETKDGISVKFDKESAPEPLKGRKAVYTVKLLAFRRRVLPTDAEFLEKIHEESIEKFTAKIREEMEKQTIAREAVRRENEAVELLLKKVDFDVPASMVSRAMDRSLNAYAQNAMPAGLPAEYFEQNRDKIIKEASAAAERQVRLWYLIDAIAEAEKIEAKDDERGKKVIEFILANAKK